MSRVITTTPPNTPLHNTPLHHTPLHNAPLPPQPPLERGPSWSIDTIPAFCITLERRPDRWRRFQDQPAIQHGSLTVQRFLGVDGKTIDLLSDSRISTMAKRNILTKTRRSHEELDSIGGVGCALSHIAVWQWMVDHGQEYVLVFEDDAVVPPDFTERANAVIANSTVLRQPGGWDMWLLGGHWDDLSAIPQESGSRSSVVRVGSFVLFHAYVMTLAMAKRLLADVYPIQCHIDMWVSIEAYLTQLRIVGSFALRLTQYERAKTDIQTASTCAICNVPTNFSETHVLVSRTERNLIRVAEVTAIVAAVLWGLSR